MTTFLLTWNPDKWVESDEEAMIETTARGNAWFGNWSVGARKKRHRTR
jgi:hypothetical protein